MRPVSIVKELFVKGICSLRCKSEKILGWMVSIMLEMTMSSIKLLSLKSQLSSKWSALIVCTVRGSRQWLNGLGICPTIGSLDPVPGFWL